MTVHYVGTLLDGTQFDSSRGRDEPFKFKLRAGQVIKGWDEAVESMKKGEVARVTLKPEYAYGTCSWIATMALTSTGAAGSPPTIPPNATLVFEIELLSWVDEKDISKKSDESIMKKTIKEGDGWERPKAETLVKIHFSVSSSSGTVIDDTFAKGKQLFEYRVSAGDVNKALNRAVKDMKKGEVARVKVKAGAHLQGGTATKPVPADTDVVYMIELVDMVKEKEPFEMTNEEKFANCTLRREEGNSFFKDSQFKRAAKRYKSALDCVKNDHTFNPEEKKKALELQLPCLLNQSACFLKLNKWKEATETTGKALDIDSGNVKALFRRAQASMGKGDTTDAICDLKKAREKQPQDKDVAALLSKCIALQKVQDEKDKAMFSRMFA